MYQWGFVNSAANDEATPSVPLIACTWTHTFVVRGNADGLRVSILGDMKIVDAVTSGFENLSSILSSQQINRLLHCTDSQIPVLMPERRSVLAVACGWAHALIVVALNKGAFFRNSSIPNQKEISGAIDPLEVYAWGSNEHGQLGLGFVSDPIFQPTCIPFPNSSYTNSQADQEDKTSKSISFKKFHSKRQKLDDGDDGCGGVLGGLPCPRPASPTAVNSTRSPLTVPNPALSPSAAGGVAVAAGQDHSLLLVRGRLWACGSLAYGRCGIQLLPSGDASRPALDTLKAEAGAAHPDSAPAVSAASPRSTCQESRPAAQPALVALFQPVALCGQRKVVKVASHWMHSLAITEDGRLWSWGLGECVLRACERVKFGV
jgi:hypothetical protein